MQEGTGERRDREKCYKKVSRSQDLQDLSTRKIAQLQQQRMQVLRCQEFEPSFFAESQGLEVRTDRPAAFDCICEDNIGSRYTQRRTDERPWRPSVPTRVGLFHAFVRTHMKDRNAEWEGTGERTDRCHARRCP